MYKKIMNRNLLLIQLRQFSGATLKCIRERSMKILKHLLDDESGATAIEYGLIAALVSVAIITILTTLGDNLNTTFTTVSDSLGGASSSSSSSSTTGG
jgi:pilus assembly protein Flp/PilA